ncbi:sushi domain-containing protein 1 isoform X2 [Hemicordylus capensis]|uniref:sushi domain-containing protein 1 isoform X2 n=1 Tax=Hemicordylus capensis TaxID=884348 RepID=UPI0023022975|nr:sushi domain-containing protein 1 isoform X2 [Hemicordylus capensis]
MWWCAAGRQPRRGPPSSSLLAPWLLLLLLAPLLLSHSPEEKKKRDADLPPNICVSCHANATCQQENGKHVCKCIDGFWGNGRSICQDKNECSHGATKMCGEHSTCHNTPGSYYCACLDGYQASSKNKTFIPNDGTHCEDINECNVSDICGLGGQCVNTIGSYECYCMEGYSTENGTEPFQPLIGNISCKVVDCGLPPPLPNAYLALVNKTSYGNKVVYTCHPPYVIESGNWTAVCNSTGRWEGADPMCKEIDCGKPPWLPHTNIIWDNTTTLGSRIYYTCKEGFQPFRGRNFSQCTINQKWENITFECRVAQIWPSGKLQNPDRTEMEKSLRTPNKEINCGQPPSVSNSDMIWDNTSTLGSVVKYKCKKGFFSTSVKSTSNCTSKGSWEILDLGCTKVLGFHNFTVNNYCLTWRRLNAAVNETYRLTIRTLNSYKYNSLKIADELKINLTTSEETVKICLPLRRATNYSVTIIEESSNRHLRVLFKQPVAENEVVFGNISIFNDNCIKWQRESRRTQSEETYVFHIQGLRWYQKQFHDKRTLNLTTHLQTPEVCLNLLPGSNYTVNISTANLDHSAIVYMTTPISDPQSPEVGFVSAEGSASLLTLSASLQRKAEEINGPISSYQVIAVPWSPQCNFSCYSLSSLTYFSKVADSDGYVAAEFPAKVLADDMLVFTLGDRLYYGEFYNAPLKLGKNYCIILRTVSEWDEVKKQSCVVWAQIKDSVPEKELQLKTLQQHTYLQPCWPEGCFPMRLDSSVLHRY